MIVCSKRLNGCVSHFTKYILYMKFVTILIVLILSLSIAEKYAMVFGTANGWSNYSITSVSESILFDN